MLPRAPERGRRQRPTRRCRTQASRHPPRAPKRHQNARPTAVVSRRLPRGQPGAEQLKPVFSLTPRRSTLRRGLREPALSQRSRASLPMIEILQVLGSGVVQIARHLLSKPETRVRVDEPAVGIGRFIHVHGNCVQTTSLLQRTLHPGETAQGIANDAAPTGKRDLVGIGNIGSELPRSGRGSLSASGWLESRSATPTNNQSQLSYRCTSWPANRPARRREQRHGPLRPAVALP